MPACRYREHSRVFKPAIVILPTRSLMHRESFSILHSLPLCWSPLRKLAVYTTSLRASSPTTCVGMVIPMRDTPSLCHGRMGGGRALVSSDLTPHALG